MFNVRAFTETRFNDAVLLTTGYSYTRLNTDIGGSRIYGGSFDAPYLPVYPGKQANDAGYVNLSGGEYPSLAAAQAAGVATMNYGLFINAVIAFLIVALVLFLVIKAMNSARRAEAAPPPPPAPPAPSSEEKLLGEIRDLLRARA